MRSFLAFAALTVFFLVLVADESFPGFGTGIERLDPAFDTLVRGTPNWRSSPKASSGAKVRRGSKARSFSPTCQTTSSISGSPAIPLHLCL